MTLRQAILIVDDRPNDLLALERTLDGMDVDLVGALSGSEALAVAGMREFALAILDVHMPAMDGLELASRLRGAERTAHLPIILMTTADASEDRLAAGYETGAIDFMVKSISPVAVRAKVRALLEMDRQRRQLSEHRLQLEQGIEARTAELREALALVRQQHDDAERRGRELESLLAQRQRANVRDRLARDVLDVLNRQDAGEDGIRDILRLIRQVLGVEAVALRLRDADDFPYYVTEGFADDFVASERLLCARTNGGGVARDRHGHVALACLCGEVVRGRDPDRPCSSSGGSFWTNDLRGYLASDKGSAKAFRGRCLAEGHESIALVPLRSGGETLGLLQVNDTRRDRFDAETIQFFEDLGASIAIAISRAGAERALQSSEEQMRHVQRMEAVGRLAGGVAHDFNNLVSVILSTCGFLETDLPEGGGALDDVREIKKAAESAAKLTHQLLAFSRRQVLEPRVLDLNSLVRDLHGMLARLVGEDVKVTLDLAPELALVNADPGQTEQVIVNLVVNARDAMADGGEITIRTRDVEIDARFIGEHGMGSPGRFVAIEVADNGTGMNAATKARLFEPFFTTKDKGKGTGLGLSTAYGIVKQSGGFVDVRSELGKGSVFTVYLPRNGVGARLRPTPATGTALSVKGDETILVVEDNPQLRALATRALGQCGYKVLGASGLEEARRISNSLATIHLLLTDVIMPGGSGREVSTEVTSRHQGVKVLYMSGYTADIIAQHGVLDPGLEFLPKPFTTSALCRRVREVLDGGAQPS